MVPTNLVVWAGQHRRASRLQPPPRVRDLLEFSQLLRRLLTGNPSCSWCKATRSSSVHLGRPALSRAGGTTLGRGMKMLALDRALSVPLAARKVRGQAGLSSVAAGHSGR